MVRAAEAVSTVRPEVVVSVIKKETAEPVPEAVQIPNVEDVLMVISAAVSAV